jgi:hypothetical protein
VIALDLEVIALDGAADERRELSRSIYPAIASDDAGVFEQLPTRSSVSSRW